MVVLLGIARGDAVADAQYLARRTANIRIFNDESGTMNLSMLDVASEALVVSQFTLYADTLKGNRPSYMAAAPPEEAEPLYNAFVLHLGELIGAEHVQTGVFRSDMRVEIINDGPVTILIESK